MPPAILTMYAAMMPRLEAREWLNAVSVINVAMGKGSQRDAIIRRWQRIAEGPAVDEGEGLTGEDLRRAHAALGIAAG